MVPVTNMRHACHLRLPYHQSPNGCLEEFSLFMFDDHLYYSISLSLSTSLSLPLDLSRFHFLLHCHLKSWYSCPSMIITFYTHWMWFPPCRGIAQIIDGFFARTGAGNFERWSTSHVVGHKETGERLAVKVIPLPWYAMPLGHILKHVRAEFCPIHLGHPLS